jgi:NAD-dependent deacetylase
MQNTHSYLTDLTRVANALHSCSSVLFITGAGVSADSGLPTYRGIGGLYDVDTTVDGLPIETLLSGEMMRSNPQLTWKYIRQIEMACRGARFNRAHEIIAEFGNLLQRVWVLTQNVDSFHSDAGSRNVIEIHGNLRQLTCLSCPFDQAVEDFEHLDTLPACPDCGGIVRPDVVLFGEMLPAEKVHLLQDELAQGFDVVFTIGTSSLFPYIMEPIYLAKMRGSLTVEINPGDTEVSHIVDVKLPLSAATAMDAIWTFFQQTRF